MSRNIQADGAAEDLIRAFVQVACAESHAKTLLEKWMAELDEGLIDIEDDAIVQEQTDKINDTIDEINSLAELRRSMMLRLFNMYNGDKNYWCMVKHLGTAAYTMFEAWQATDDDSYMLSLAMEANRRFIKALSRFLGTTVTECAACFADALKGAADGT